MSGDLTERSGEAVQRQAIELLRRIEPYIDSIVCYASTQDYDGNKLYADFQAFMAGASNNAQRPVTAYRVWARGRRFTRGLYEAATVTAEDREIWALDGGELEPLYLAETQRSSESEPAK